MRLQIIFRKFNKGLTLVEILIVMGIFIFISSFGLFLSFDTLSSQRFLTEEIFFLTLLKISRNRALGNLNNSSHGIFISEDSFILFEGENFDPNSKSNETFSRNKKIEIRPDNLEIVFENLTGRALSKQFLITDGIRQNQIYVNQEGKIN